MANLTTSVAAFLSPLPPPLLSPPSASASTPNPAGKKHERQSKFFLPCCLHIVCELPGGQPREISLFSTLALRQHHYLNLHQTAAAARNVTSRCECHDLYEESVPYVTAWKWQKETVDSMCAALTRGEEPTNSVLLLQHRPVYTMRTRSWDGNLCFDKENPPFELHRTERGGEVTYHGPGQLVMYPILNLRHPNMDLHWYLRALEEVVIRTLWSACGLQASRIDGLTGV
ncbi:unnamed protein product [Calypogeia fissa]